jgi:TRAP-type C4-dicarboxylate transport system substrate-binding protein
MIDWTSREEAHAMRRIMAPFRILLPMTLLLALLAIPCQSASAQQTLLMTTMSPAGSANIVKNFKPWADRINAQADGTVTVDTRAGTVLANFGNILERVQDDVVQIGWALPGVAAGRFPLTEVGAFPFLTYNAEEASVAFWRLYKSGLLDAEYRDIVPLMFGLFSQYQIHLSKQPRSLDNLTGLKIAGNAKAQVDAIQRLGGTPLSIPTQDHYEALQRGTIDGVITGWGAFDAYKLGEVTSFHIEVPLGTAVSFLFMSRNKYESLPAAARRAIDDNSGEAGTRRWANYLDTLTNAQRELHKPSDTRKVVELSPEQSAHWRTVLEPQLDDWAGSRPGGAKVLATYRTLVEEVRAETKK